MLVFLCGSAVQCHILRNSEKWPAPTTVRELRNFLGAPGIPCVSHYAKIPIAANRASPKGSQNTAYSALNSVNLHIVRLDKRFFIRTDPSKVAVGGVLEQRSSGSGLRFIPESSEQLATSRVRMCCCDGIETGEYDRQFGQSHSRITALTRARGHRRAESSFKPYISSINWVYHFILAGLSFKTCSCKTRISGGSPQQ